MIERLKLKTLLDDEDVPIEELVKEVPPSSYQSHALKGKSSSKIDLKNRKAQGEKHGSQRKRTSLAERIIEGRSPQELNLDNQLFQSTLNENSQVKQMVSKRKDKFKKLKSMSNVEKEAETPKPEEKNHQLFEQNEVLKNIIRKYKIKSIVANFVNKIKRVSVLKDPVSYSEYEEYNKPLLWKQSGFNLPPLAENVINLVTIFQIICFAFVLSITLVYSELQQNIYITDFQSLTLVILVIEMILNLTTVKHHSGKKIQSLIQIWEFYLRGYLIIDLLGVIILVCNIFSTSTYLNYLKVIILAKIGQCLDKIEKLEVYFIKNLYNQQYWSLVKILFFNFLFAHIISILLTAMAYLNPGQNWMTVKQIQMAPWYQKYSWSYYWANTIMLTVGFGDIVAHNYQEAICLVFIQTFSCMAFAYNINCIGSIIQQIRAKDAERSQKSKIFTKLNDKNNLSEDLSYKISNYIEETARLRKNFDYEEQRQFIANLPLEMKKDYLKQSNKIIFQNIHFFKSFISKTLFNLAEKIEMKVSHPEQTIQHLYDDYNLMILKAGRLGFVCKRPNSELGQFVMDSKVVKETDTPYLVNLDFITRKRSNYEIKSMQYSIFYFLPYDKFMEVLRETEMDYEFFCTLRDRMKSIPDEFQVFSCQVCKGKHLKALCPKLHYIPYQENIIHKYLRSQKIQENCRSSFKRQFKDVKYQNAFYVYRKSVQNVEKLGNLIQSRRRVKTNTTDASIKSEHESSQRNVLLSQTEMEKELKMITDQYKNVTMEILKEQITKLIKIDQEEDQVWALKIDTIQNFNAYFPEHNPSNIAGRYLQLSELLRSQNVLKEHTSALLQRFQNNRLGTKQPSASKSKAPRLAKMATKG